MIPVETINGFRPLEMTPAAEASLLPKTAPAGGVDFSKLVSQGLEALNQQQARGDQQVAGFLSGEGPALHTVMLGVEQASLSMEFAVQLRNRAVEAYNEIMRMQF